MLGLLAVPATAAAQPPADQFSVLVFSKTAGFRHDSIPAGIAAVQQLGAANDFAVDATEDAAAFTDANLARYAAVIWLSTTGDVLNAEQQGAFERYIRAGGGYVGIHAASDTEYDWPWYGELVGAYFTSHPQIQQADIVVPDRVHPSTEGLPQRWTRTDEWYNFRANPRGRVHVLAALDEASYAPGAGAMGHDHPISWCQNVDGGRAWYTGIGHTAASYSEPEALAHLLGGIRTAAGYESADCGATVDESFDQVTLAMGEEKTGEPIALAVLPDRRVLHTSRDGRVWLTTPEATTSLAASVPVYTHDEDGLQGIAIDPDFESNRWVYLYYAPPLDTPAGDAPTDGPPGTFDPWNGYNQLSRFRFLDDGTLDLASEQRILQVPANRGICCHAGGEIDFDAAGNLYLSTGDDTNPFASDGYTPIDERATRNPAFDAQRTSANSNDLRGKVLRITVGADGTYTVPAGNLFAPGTERTRPEIYAMGFRNPFRFAVDRATGVLYLGDYGPDAGAANPGRGPGGTVEFNRITGPGNFGWPYCTGDQLAYVDYQFPSGPSGATFDCAAPVNDSPNNTGLRQLPPAQAAWLPYDGASRPEFGSGSESPMGGPVYDFDPALASPTKFPEYYDGKVFLHEWERSWIKAVTLAGDGSAEKIDPFFDSMTLVRPMNLEFGPDGSLYVLDYGTGYFGGSPESAVYRIDYTQGTRAPRVRLSADPTSGQAPLTVRFDPAGTEDPDGDPITYAWDFTGDGTVDSTEPGPVEHTYTANGTYTARLTVSDSTGRDSVATVRIVVGNTAPTVVLDPPPNGGVFSFGDRVPFRVTVTDPEDGANIDCSRVVVEYILGHDDHGHPLSRATGCEGELLTVADEGHGPEANVFGVVNATYTDGGANGQPALTGSDEAVLQPRAKQAEHFAEANGITVVDQAQASGGRRVGYIDNGDWIAFDPLDLQGVTDIGYRISSGGAGGTIEVRSGAVDGPLVQTVQVPSTGGWDNYLDLAPAPITAAAGDGPLYLVFRGTGTGGLFDVDLVRLVGGVGVPPEPPCEDPGAPVDPSDTFDGDELDRCRWPTVLREYPDGYRVAGGALEIDARPGDMYNGTVDAQNIVLQPAPAGGRWTATTRMSITGTSDYVQGGLIAHSTDQNFVKAVLIHMPGQGWRLENGSTVNGQSVADQSGPLPAGINSDAWLRLHADGGTLTVSVSADGQNWQQVGPARSLANLPNPRVGLAAFHGVAGERARFDSFTLDEPAECAPADPGAGYRSLFDGTGTAGWAQAGPGGFDLVNCELLSRGGLGLYWYQAESFDSYSLKLDWKVAGDDNSGVFVGFPDPGTDPWVAVNRGHEVQIDATDAPDRTTGAIYAFRSADLAARDAALNPPGEWNAYEIVVTGDRIRVYLNDVLINDYTDTDPNRMNAPSFVGIQNHGDGDDVYFRNIRIKELDTAAPTTLAATTPDEPNGSGGWFRTAPVTVTLTASDAGGGTVTSTEYRVDGGAWTAYTAPFTVTAEGRHTVEYRSTDDSGNVEVTRSLAVDIDTVAPALTVGGITENRVYGDATDLVVSYAGSDATSGLAGTGATLDGTALASGALVALYRLPLGVHQLRAEAVDAAGNRTVRTVSFATTTSLRDLGQLLDRFRATNRLPGAAYDDLSRLLSQARVAEAAGRDERAVRLLRDFATLANRPVRVPDAEVRATLVRDAEAVIDAIQGSVNSARFGRAVR
ncbi:MAG TPA: ThuA domain-containing protein [Pseudonocardiaceae bacterium]